MACPAITEEECDYNEEKLVFVHSTADEKQCQNLCLTLKYPECGYWTFHKSQKDCYAWEARVTPLPNTNCTSIGGSKEPSLLQCIGIF